MRNYMIIDTADLSLVDFEQVLETSEDTLRLSTNSLRTFIKWEKEPDFISQLNNTMGPYTHKQIKEIMTYDEWNEPAIEDIYEEEE